MKASFVDAVAEPVVRSNLWRMLVCVEYERDRLGSSAELAQHRQLIV
jgi:hypothetical protein